jgi:hypothetical protein
MTDEQLDEIESVLGVSLPAEYRRVSREFPFQPIGRDRVYWFYDDPRAVIHETRHPMEDGEYAGSDLLPQFVVIGRSAAGDAYLLDLNAPSPAVASLSHETHAIDSERQAFAAFVAEWLQAPDEAVRRAVAEQARQRGWWRRYWMIASVIALVGFVLPLVLFILASSR